MVYCVSGVVFYLESIPASPHLRWIWKMAKPGFREHPLLILLLLLSSSDKGLRMIVLVSLIVLLEDFLFPLFFAQCIPTYTSPFIHLNDFSTCIIYTPHSTLHLTLHHTSCCTHPLSPSTPHTPSPPPPHTGPQTWGEGGSSRA